MNASLQPGSARPASVNLNTASAAEAALRTFWRLADAWKLTTAKQLTLLGVARTTLPDLAPDAVAWLPCHRLIAARFPTVGLYDEVAAPQDLDAVFAIEGSDLR